MSARFLLCRQGCYYVGRIVTMSAWLLLFWQGCYYVGTAVIHLQILVAVNLDSKFVLPHSKRSTFISCW